MWDEFPSTDKRNFEAVDRMLREIRCCPNLPFGGLTFIAAGDFQQIPPIVENGNKDQILAASVRNSELWKYFTIFTLTIPVRQIDDEEHAR
jgi:hypothetical protein